MTSAMPNTSLPNTAKAVFISLDGTASIVSHAQFDHEDLQIIEVHTPKAFWQVMDQNDGKVVALFFDRSIAPDSLDGWLQDIIPGIQRLNLPIIVHSENVTAEYEQALLETGVTHVLSGDVRLSTINSLLSFAVGEFKRISDLLTELERRTSAIGQIISGNFRFHTREEARNLATMLSLACPDPGPIAIGLAELMINSIEHGNLEIGHEEKGRLIESGCLSEEIEKRFLMPDYKDRYVTLEFWHKDNKYMFRITDKGQGFDHLSFGLGRRSISKKNGRGIVMAFDCFDSVEYVGCGNQVMAIHIANS